jgi:hypothetical protein
MSSIRWIAWNEGPGLSRKLKDVEVSRKQVREAYRISVDDAVDRGLGTLAIRRRSQLLENKHASGYQTTNLGVRSSNLFERAN